MNATGWLPLLAAVAVLCATRAQGRLRWRAGEPARAPLGPSARRRVRAGWSRDLSGEQRATMAATGTAMVILWSALVVGVAVAAVEAVMALAVRALRRHRRRRRIARDQARAIPDLVDLFKLAASGGQPAAAALVTVAARAPVPVRPAVQQAGDHLAAGGSLGGAFERLASGLGPAGRELVEALADAARTGTSLVPVLDRVGATARDRRTREAEEAARRLPVTLLFPLAGCVLPAAVLLAVVPVLAASLASLAS